jgi:hypothetical protein
MNDIHAAALQANLRRILSDIDQIRVGLKPALPPVDMRTRLRVIEGGKGCEGLNG